MVTNLWLEHAGHVLEAQVRVRNELLCERVVERGKEKMASHPFHEVAKCLRCTVQGTRCYPIPSRII
jgi:hypothetical protein